MPRRAYVPKQGDVVWLNLTPQAGHEQAGHRPALVLSPGAYNGRAGMALVCPITNQVKGYPFEVAISGLPGVSGVVLADQIHTLDWRARRATYKAKADAEVVCEVLAKIAPLLAYRRDEVER
ncbi:endoribonuclease MazF [Nitrococcus mobilis]|uniref:Transcriptional modulator of MazE/toxin, MazF n=1 Tax=Nitrococcus mobilis Nb-231 TaxID=314278 RepID=A4BMA4_9GAMM|nr:endoribonuclease MazF [Nitrococcus mobilis]EAR23442.1 transcriptional modulator of MazE/toxin, MazF [Nitrococcus mobilis Nb-231]